MNHHHQHQHQHQHQHHPIRARHTIRLSSIRHNYNVVSSAANKQRCSVITVVKADGYGHGAIETATHLADYCGADAFAVATLEEGIALRKALMETNLNIHRHNNNNSRATATTTNVNVNANANGAAGIGGNLGSKLNKTKNKIASITSSSLFTPPTPTPTPTLPKSIDVQSHSSDVSSILPSSKILPTTTSTTTTTITIPRKKIIRSNNIRIIVLGPPTNIPNDFHLYNHYNIELMVSSSTMARALMEWVADCDGRRIAEVDQVANDRLKEIVDGSYLGGDLMGEEVERKGALGMRNAMMNMDIHRDDDDNDDNGDGDDNDYGDDDTKNNHNNCDIDGGDARNINSKNGAATSTGSDKKGGGNKDGVNGKPLLQPTKNTSTTTNKSTNKSTSKSSANVISHRGVVTLTSVEGSALGKEVRELLNKKKDAAATAATTAAAVTAVAVGNLNGNGSSSNGENNNHSHSDNQSVDPSRASLTKSIGNNNGVVYTIPTINRSNRASPTPNSSITSTTATTSTQPFPFKGIEDTAKESRRLQLAAEKLTAHFTGEGEDSSDDENDDCGLNHNYNYNHNNDHDHDHVHGEYECSSVSVTASKTSTTSSSSLVNNSNNNGNGNGSGHSSGSGSSNIVSIVNENELDDGGIVKTVSSAVASAAIAAATNNAIPIKARKRVRWHMLVDSGMGRLGFKSVEDEDDDDSGNDNDNGGGSGGEKEEEKKGGDRATSPYNGSGIGSGIGSGNCSLFGVANLGPNGEKKKDKWKEGPHRDTVSMIKDMTHAEIDGAPIEFYGMCTHMAEASSNSSYTNEQMNRFKSLLRRVRQAGICVPTISTDNSSALLTPTLTHFDPVELLSQPAADTRGFVRTGGAVYGQRPAFTQLRAVSTLTASVRHVAAMKRGESVGYDRAYIAEKNVRIATLSIGFADGYPRELGNGKGKVCIRGKIFPVAGNVCMDMLMVDLGSAGDICDVGAQVSIGDTAYLWGPEVDDDGEGEIRLQDVAKSLNTTQSALTCGLDKIRVQRQYID